MSDSTIRSFCEKVVTDSHTHAKWLNSLAYLEYRGFRKIAFSHSTEQLSLELLQHCAEEVRHAVFFKRQAIKLGGSKLHLFSNDTLFSADALKRYFYEIDCFTRKHIMVRQTEGFTNLAYMVVTWLVEVRATAVYRIYEEVLRRSNSDFSLAAILREEELHLKKLGLDAEKLLMSHGFDRTIFLECERKEFERLWTALESDIFILALEGTPQS